ncbi:hypothetical protein B0H11DRAFT_2126332 [Mycena galericulata]|nr:hypothetical protein B0H11DRAFT_2126332 [Mycena galericulata]
MSRIFPHGWPPSRAGGGSAAFDCNWRQASKLFFNPSADVSTLFFPNSTPRLLPSVFRHMYYHPAQAGGQCRAQRFQETQPESDRPSVRNKSSPGEAFSTEACIHFGKKKDRRRPLMDDPTWFDSHSAVIHAQKTDLRLAGGLCSVGDLT